MRNSWKRPTYFDPPKIVTRGSVLAAISRMKVGDWIVRDYLFKERHVSPLGGFYTLPLIFCTRGHRNREKRRLNAILAELVRRGVLSRYDGTWTKKAKHVVRREVQEDDW